MPAAAAPEIPLCLWTGAGRPAPHQLHIDSEVGPDGMARAGNFGVISAAQDSRQIQLGPRYSF
jgi:hypothetical protein